jgi:hypothetical protein
MLGRSPSGKDDQLTSSSPISLRFSETLSACSQPPTLAKFGPDNMRFLPIAAKHLSSFHSREEFAAYFKSVRRYFIFSGNGRQLSWEEKHREDIWVRDYNNLTRNLVKEAFPDTADEADNHDIGKKLLTRPFFNEAPEPNEVLDFGDYGMPQEPQVNATCNHCQAAMDPEALFGHICAVRLDFELSPESEDSAAGERKELASLLSMLVSANPAAYTFFKDVHATCVQSGGARCCDKERGDEEKSATAEAGAWKDKGGAATVSTVAPGKRKYYYLHDLDSFSFLQTLVAFSSGL